MKEYLIDCFGVWKHVDPELVARLTPSSEWVEIPEDAELMFTNDCDQSFLRVFAKEDDGVVFVSWNGDWSVSKWESIKTLAKHFSNEVLWKREKETVNPINRNEFNPLIPQEGGDHYKFRPIQPIEYSERNGLSMSQGNIVKYITRHKEKNGIEDLAKVVHYALLEAYFVYDVKGSTELKQRILKMLGD